MKNRLFTLSRAGLLATVLAPLLPLEATHAKDEWPQFRGPAESGHSAAVDLPREWSEQKNVRWKTAVPGRGHSSPVISDNQIWLTTAIATPLSAEEKAERLARVPNSKSLELVGAVSLRAVCIDRESGQVTQDIELLKVAEPEPIHSLNSYASPTPVLENGRLYCHFGSYGTVALDTQTGRTLWTDQTHRVDHQNGPGGSPASWKNLLLFNFDGIDRQYVAALDKETGRTVWATKRSGQLHDQPDFQKAYVTPSIVETPAGPQLVSPGADWVYAYDPATGRELWKASYGTLGFSTVPRPVFGHGLTFISTSFINPRLLAVRYDGTGDVTSTHVAWQQDGQWPKKPSLLLVDEQLYFMNDSGVAFCLEAKTGKEVWRKRVGGDYSASPLAADGHLYFFSQDGRATVLKPGAEYQLVAENTLDAGFMASPAVAGKALFLRTETHLYRIENGGAVKAAAATEPAVR